VVVAPGVVVAPSGDSAGIGGGKVVVVLLVFVVVVLLVDVVVVASIGWNRCPKTPQPLPPPSRGAARQADPYERRDQPVGGGGRGRLTINPG